MSDNIMMLKVYGDLEKAKNLIDEAMKELEDIQPVKIQKEAHTVDDVREMFRKMIEQAAPEAKKFIRDCLQRHKAAKVSDLRPEQCDQVWKECREWTPF